MLLLLLLLVLFGLHDLLQTVVLLLLLLRERRPELHAEFNQRSCCRGEVVLVVCPVKAVVSE